MWLRTLLAAVLAPVLKAYGAVGWKFLLGVAGEVTISSGQETRPTLTTTGILKRDVSDELYKKEPERATLLQIMQGTRRVEQDARLFEWIEQDLDPRYVTVGAITPGAGSTGTIAMTAGDLVTLMAGQTLILSTAISVHITAVASTTITVDNITGLVQGQTLLIGAHVTQELSAEPTALSRIPNVLNNQMITARDAWGYSNWVATDNYYGPVRQKEERDDAMMQHKISLDVEAWGGRQPGSQLTLSGNNINYTNGVFAQIVTNRVTIPSGVLTWETLTSLCQAVDRLMSSPNPVMFVSRAVWAILDVVAYGKSQSNTFTMIGGKWGVRAKLLSLGSKEYRLVLVDHWTGPQLGTIMVGIDLKELTLRSVAYKEGGNDSGLRWMIEYMRGMDITGNDGTTGCFTTDMGVRLRNEQGAFIISNVLSY
jgi:hypothetical protein